MTEAHSRRVWRDLPEDVQEVAVRLAKAGDAHPDSEVAEAALKAVRRDYRRIVWLRHLFLWIGAPGFGGLVLTVLYLGGHIPDAPWWLVIVTVLPASLFYGYIAISTRGSVPPPIGSDLPFAMDESLQTRTPARKRVLTSAGIALGALAAACLIVVLLDKPADLRGGLKNLALFLLLCSAGTLGRGVFNRVAERWNKWRKRSGDRS